MKQDGWQFTWRKLGKTEGAQFCKLTTVDKPTEVEGMLMLTLINEEMLYMNNIEVSPSNYGRAGKYKSLLGNPLPTFDRHFRTSSSSRKSTNNPL